MRYDNGKDWVEIAHVAHLPMKELEPLDGDMETVAHPFVVSKTVDAHFTDYHGNVVDWRTDVLALTLQQWHWWKRMIWAAARDEKLDPEASGASSQP